MSSDDENLTGIVDLNLPNFTSSEDDDGGNMRGAIYTLLMNNDGTVKNHQKISDTEVGPNQNNLNSSPKLIVMLT